MIFVLAILGISLIIYLVAGMLVLLGQFTPRTDKSSRKPGVSIIVAARNEENNIARCLESLVNQTYNEYEIVVVNDRSDDRTRSIIASFLQSHSRLRTIDIESPQTGWSPKKYALDCGIRASSGEILLFTDADCVAGPQWVESMVRFFTPDTGLVAGFSKVESQTFVEHFQQFDFLAMMTAAVGACNIGYPLAASGQNMGYRREAFEEVGGFTSIKQRLSGDDVLMMHLIRSRTRWKIRFAGEASSFITTRPVKGLWSFIQQRARWASNGTIMIGLSPLFFVYLASVLGVQLGIAAGIVGSFFQPVLGWSVAFALVTKSVVDFAVIVNGARLLNVRPSVGMLFLWEVAQIPYMLVAGLLGITGLFRWKR